MNLLATLAAPFLRSKSALSVIPAGSTDGILEERKRQIHESAEQTRVMENMRTLYARMKIMIRDSPNAYTFVPERRTLAEQGRPKSVYSEQSCNVAVPDWAIRYCISYTRDIPYSANISLSLQWSTSYSLSFDIKNDLPGMPRRIIPQSTAVSSQDLDYFLRQLQLR